MLKHLAPDVQRTGVKILLEPLTKKETHCTNVQGHGAGTSEQSGTQCARLLSDFYHMRMEEQDLVDPRASPRSPAAAAPPLGNGEVGVRMLSS